MTRAIIVTDIGYGDAGKGSMVDFLARQASSNLVVRYNGGPQAAHNVITPDGRHHTFAQMGSASFVDGTCTHLSRFMLVNPFNLALEIEHLETLGPKGLWDRLTIDEEAMVITPWHIAANRIREISRSGGRHGSCGQGIGETKFDSIHFPEEVLTVADLASPATIRRKLDWVRNLKLIQLNELLVELPNSEPARREREILESRELIETCVEFYTDFLRHVRVVGGNELASLMAKSDQTIFEGAQGVLLDEDYGFHPYTTWSVTTSQNAETLLAEVSFNGELERLGVMRAYMSRHGAGPFVTEDGALTTAIPDYHNVTNDWQEGFRVGHLDFVVLSYALAATRGVDALAVTNLDRLAELTDISTCSAYRLPPVHRTSPYFSGNGDLATGIHVGPKNRRDYQETITKVLFGTEPVLEPFEGDDSQYLELIESKLGAPVKYTSAGPTALDKTYL
jgi:adenylosuccinate synthase